MLEDDPSDQRVPHGSDREIVATPLTMMFELFHQRFVREIVENQLQSAQIAQRFDLVPPKKLFL
jgi:hypothetical protein